MSQRERNILVYTDWLNEAQPVLIVTNLAFERLVSRYPLVSGYILFFAFSSQVPIMLRIICNLSTHAKSI